MGLKLTLFNQPDFFSMMSLKRDSILRKAILFLLMLGCREETLDTASVINWLYIVASDYAIPQRGRVYI